MEIRESGLGKARFSDLHTVLFRSSLHLFYWPIGTYRGAAATCAPPAFRAYTSSVNSELNVDVSRMARELNKRSPPRIGIKIYAARVIHHEMRGSAAPRRLRAVAAYRRINTYYISIRTFFL
ncbi:hypothetical protein EVAR_99069_1 [Eumeta japonica]|uniref:Uncharacterized protein n=1 Tax=Eumeta variegata TaxID=151549 RepID=A0A4C1SMW7_EUMVA|nr:hypothetical protein EVAR_99069_1 [Eumeta japonica]